MGLPVFLWFHFNSPNINLLCLILKHPFLAYVPPFFSLGFSLFSLVFPGFCFFFTVFFYLFFGRPNPTPLTSGLRQAPRQRRPYLHVAEAHEGPSDVAKTCHAEVGQDLLGLGEMKRGPLICGSFDPIPGGFSNYFWSFFCFLGGDGGVLRCFPRSSVFEFF